MARSARIFDESGNLLGAWSPGVAVYDFFHPGQAVIEEGITGNLGPNLSARAASDFFSLTAPGVFMYGAGNVIGAAWGIAQWLIVGLVAFAVIEAEGKLPKRR